MATLLGGLLLLALAAGASASVRASDSDLVVCPLMDNGVTNGPLDSGLHPNSDGYTVIARAVRDAILLALGAPPA